MKIFTEKGILKKLILILVVLVLFNALIPNNVSFAASDEDSAGGVLLKPIADLMLILGDAVMDLMHNVIYGMDTALIRVDKDNGIWEFIAIAGAFLVALGLIIAGGVALTGAALKIIGAIAAHIGTGATATALTAAAVGTLVSVAIQGGVAAGMFVRSEFFSDEVVFPLYQISPEEIFRGEISLLNVNFFKDEAEILAENNSKEIDVNTTAITNRQSVFERAYNVTRTMSGQDPTALSTAENAINQALKDKGYSGDRVPCILSGQTTRRWNVKDASGNNVGYMATIDVVSSGILTELTPSVIDTYTIKIEKGEWVGQETTTLGIELRPTIAKWYYNIRNFALIVMMVVLLYIGIRIMLCGVSSEKAKYKNMLMDWVIAICLIFIMHYIMAFSMNIVDGISKIFGSVNIDAGLSAKQKEEYVVLYEEDSTVISKLRDAGIDVSELVTDGVITWDAKNILGMVRVSAALSNSGSYLYIGYVMCYIVLVIFTVFFMFTYLKRALYLTFFTIIAPLVAMTYPLDKLHDGKAQAFDMWFKEYIFNLMIQPVHLLLYTVLISSAIQLAQENILYTLVAIGFMMPAEKFLRKMFGFDKAQTPGFLSGAAGTALMVTGFNKLFNRKPSKGGSGIGDGGGSSGGKAIGSDDAGTIDLTDNASLMQKLGEEKKPKDPREDEIKKPKPKPEPPRDSQHKLPPGFLPNGELDMSYLYSLSGKGNSTSTSSDVQEELSKLQKYQAQKYQKSLKGRLSKFKGTVGSKYSKFKGAVGKKLSPALEYSKNFTGQILRRKANDIANGKPIRTIANTAKGIYGAMAGSMIATTLALPDDNPAKQIVQNNSTLAAAAFALGSRDSKPNYDQEEAFEAAKRARYNSEEEYQKALREEQTKKVIENEKNLRKVRDYLGDEFNIKTLEDAQAFMEKHSEFIDAGYEDMDNFCTLAKLVESGQMDKTMAATTAKYYKKAGGKPKSLGKKEKENIQFICENIAKSSGLTDKAEIQKSVDIMFNNLNLYGDTMDGFKSINND